jgi:hypothetical protein
MLLDLKLQDIQGQDLLPNWHRVAGALLSLSSRAGDERVAVEMMKRGALDCPVKDVDFLHPCLGVHPFPGTTQKRTEAGGPRNGRRDITERKRLERNSGNQDQERRASVRSGYDGLMSAACRHRVDERKRPTSKLTAKSKATPRFRVTRRHVREAISHTRSRRGLAPVTLNPGVTFGFASALPQYGKNIWRGLPLQCISRSGLATPAAALVPDRSGSCLNAIKHGKATQPSHPSRWAEDRLDLTWSIMASHDHAAAERLEWV